MRVFNVLISVIIFVKLITTNTQLDIRTCIFLHTPTRLHTNIKHISKHNTN